MPTLGGLSVSGSVQPRLPASVGSVLLDIPTAIPDIRTAVHDIRTAIPDIHTAVPDIHTAVPDIRTAVPDIHTAVPDIRTAVPDIPYRCSRYPYHSSRSPPLFPISMPPRTSGAIQPGLPAMWIELITVVPFFVRLSPKSEILISMSSVTY